MKVNTTKKHSGLRFLTVRAAPGNPCRGLIRAGNRTIPCALGRSGISAFKREGDGATPLAAMKLLSGYVRADRSMQRHAAVLAAAARASLNSNGKEYQILNDLQQLRGFLVSGTMMAFLDGPFAPLFLVAIYLIHPHLGLIVGGTCVILLVIAVINQKITSRHFSDANQNQSKANYCRQTKNFLPKKDENPFNYIYYQHIS